MNLKKYPQRIYVDDDIEQNPHTPVKQFHAYSRAARINFKSMEYIRADLVLNHQADISNEDPMDEIFRRLKQLEAQI
jgi:hypothetical protein